MRNNRLGCLTGTGIIATLVTALAIAGMAFAQGNTMFSAGPLNAQSQGKLVGNVASHADVSAQCEYCHAAPWDSTTMADRCLTCHTDIAAQLPDVTRLHGVMLQFNKSLTCRNCHPEHRGATAPLTVMDPSLFPHNAEGFSLNGHQLNVNGEAFVCSDCHSVDITKFDPNVCQACHNQISTAFMQSHIQSFGVACLNCHDGVDRFGKKNFDHSKFAFQLVGKHAAIDCAKCHTGVQALQGFMSTPTDCVSCHQKDDPHGGRFGQSCDACHTPDGWKPANFNHDLASFKLTGLHIGVQCEKCHVNGVLNGAPTDCFSCHQKDDKHGGRFGTDCANCHTTDGWDKVSVDHSKFVFPLVGKHLSVACESCHVNGVFKGTPTDCYPCHKQNDPHNGQLGADCGSCHLPNAWKPANFDHNRAAFKLTGQHVNVACTQCHVNNVFKGTPQDCYSCHKQKDAHNGQFGTSCGTCHNTNAWKPAAFDHNLAAFKLTGAHVNVACASCHVNGVFKGTPQDCYSCHKQKDAHNGQFGTNCGSCHSTSTWSGVTFNHNTTGFPLTGAHVNLNCARCHQGGNFSGLSTACSSCHSDPSWHAGAFGLNCGSCHGTSSWGSGRFSGSHPSPGIDHGGASCKTCHPSSVASATCLACHDSNNPGDGGGGDGGD